MSFLVEQLEKALLEVERLEKENARLSADKERLVVKIAELESRMHPQNLVDAGQFFFKKLGAGGLEDVPYCGTCKSPMKPHYCSDDPIEFRCASEACNFALPYQDLASAFQKRGVKGPAAPGSNYEPGATAPLRSSPGA